MFASKTRNGVNSLLWVCKNQEHGPVTTDSISKRLGLSISYLESLLSNLKKLGFLVSYRGPGGGYCSNGKPGSLMLIDLVSALDFNHSSKSKTFVANSFAVDKDLANWMVQKFFEQGLLKMSFADIMEMVDEEIWGAEPFRQIGTTEPRKFKPLQTHRLPAGPNSVFNLAASMSI